MRSILSVKKHLTVYLLFFYTMYKLQHVVTNVSDGAVYTEAHSTKEPHSCNLYIVG